MSADDRAPTERPQPQNIAEKRRHNLEMAAEIILKAGHKPERGLTVPIIAQVPRKDQKEISRLIEEKAGNEIIARFDVADLHTSFAESFPQIIVTDEPLDASQHDLFYAFVCVTMTKLLDKTIRVKKQYGLFKDHPVKVEMAKLDTKYKQDFKHAFWSQDVKFRVDDTIRAMSRALDGRMMRIIITGLESVPEDEQSYLCEILNNFTKPGLYPQLLILSETRPNMGKWTKSGYMGIHSDYSVELGFKGGPEAEPGFFVGFPEIEAPK